MKRSFLIISIVTIVLTAITILAFEMNKTITIVVGEDETQIEFWGFTVADALAAAGLTLHKGDLITPGLDEFIHENSRVVITPAFWVIITVDGETHHLWTTERSPDRILELVSSRINPNDELWSNGIPIEPTESLPFAPSHSLQVRRATTIFLKSDGGIQTITSRAFTLGEALSEAGFRIYNEDHLTPSADAPLTGQEIHAELEKSREVIIQTKDQVIETRVIGDTVGEVLTRVKMPLQGLDYSIPDENQSIEDNNPIRVVNVREEILFEQEPIPFTTQYQPLSQVDLDKKQVIQVGEYGIKAQRFRVVYEDDQEVSQTLEDEWIAKEPQSRIIGYGTNINLQTANTPGGQIQYWRVVDAYATSYSPCRIGLSDQCSYNTASGAKLKKGVIGVIRSWYNYMQGLQVYIPGYGYATIEDIGAGFSDRHWIDLGYSDEDWINWSGYVKVYFLPPVPTNILYLLD